MAKLRLGVIFGSRSVEHEVSIITAMQLIKHVDREKYEVIPLYIDKSGSWWVGSEETKDYRQQDELKNHFQPFVFSPTPHANPIDVALVCCHGTMGEDGTVQGLLELAGIPYQGPGVVGSAVCMDKIITKKVLQSSNIPVVAYEWCTKQEWQENKKSVLEKVSRLSFPVFVKPANLGSSVGITKAKDTKSLEEAIEVALQFDRRILIEQGRENIKEINISVLGFEQFQASVPEEPISSGEILSYADKYEGGGKKMGGMASLKRRIPAPIPQSVATKMQETAIAAARACDVSGVARIDFLLDIQTGEYWVNELNTIPGSMSFYLWQASGLSYPMLIDKLVEIARERFASTKENTTSIQTTIL